MKINEAFEGLLKNKDSVYESKTGNYRSELSLCESGFFYLVIYDNLGKEIEPSLAGGGFSGNIMTTDEWELMRQPVDFMTAINSGKNIKPDNISSDFREARHWLTVTILSIGMVNGKWLIE